MRWAAALIHVFTGLGVVCALMAVVAIQDGAWERLFLWLGLAFFIDGIDGTFARLVGVKRHLPRFSGDRLDLVVDYVTYVFVPVIALMASGLLAGPIGIGLSALILLSSLYHFSDLESKAEDQSFVGFPAIWNIVAFYLFALQASPPVATAIVGICVILTFVPMKWVHPLRVEAWRPLTMALTVAWSVAALAAVVSGFGSVGSTTKLVLIVVAAYGIGLSVASAFSRRA